MNDFESMLSSALREEAEEISVSVDMNKADRSLDERLDGVDRGRRGHVLLALAGAAAAIVVIGAGAVVLRGHIPGAGVAQQSSRAVHQDPYFAPPFSMELPAWVTSNNVAPHENSTYSWWPHCDAPATCADLSVSRYDSLALGSTTSSLGYVQYLDHLWALGEQKVLVLSGTKETTVDGRPAMEVWASSTTGKPLVLGCAADSCQDVPANSVMRYVVIDMGAGRNPVVVFAQVAKANPQASAWLAQLDTVTRSLRFQT